MFAILVFIYIGVFCSALSNSENEGCPDLNNHTNWETTGPYIHHIKMLSAVRAVVYCQTGYHAYLNVPKLYSDHFPIACKNGSWDVFSICQEKSVNCPDPINNSNDTMWQHTQPFNYTRTTSRYTVKCEPGYDAGVHGGNRYTETILAACNGDQWTVNAVCREIECGDPNIYSNWQNSEAAERIHRIVYNETTLNSSAIVHCMDGDVVYTDDGQRNSDFFNIVCTADHRWQADGICGCPALKTEHTHDSHWHLDDAALHIATVQNYDARITLRCDEGYWLKHASIFGHPQTTQTLKCGINGTWTPAENCSMITCPALKTEHTNDSHWHLYDAALNNATVPNYDAHMPLRCDDGYWLKPASTSGYPQTTQTVKCGINGTWTPAANCSMITCPTLKTEHTNDSHWHLDDAALNNATGQNYDAHMPLRCDDGYWLKPASTFGHPQTTQTVKCGINGTWTPAANCSMITCPALKTEHTHDSHWHLDDAALNNATVQNYDAYIPLRCDDGYWLKPASTFSDPQTTQTVKCGINGTWTPASDCSVITCPALKTEHTNDSHWHLDDTTLNNATVQNYDAYIPLRCDDGYWLNPASTFGHPQTTQTVKCGINGTWTPAANCVMITCSALKTEHTNDSHWHLDDATLNNATVQNYDAYMPLRCDDGYWLHPGSTFGDPQTTQTVKCGINGTWTPAANCSLITCSALKTEHTNDSHWHLDDATLNNATVQNYDAYMPLRCDDGYWLHPGSTFGNPNTTQTVKCGINGTWTPAANCFMITSTTVATAISSSTTHTSMTTTQQSVTLMSTSASFINITVLSCIDLYLPEHWGTIGPNIQHIKILPSPNHAIVYCQPGFSAFLTSQHTYSDHFQITCRDGSWKAHSICQKIDAVHLIG
ncbi:uncharacterized protein LOC127853961 isoform X2 [Dreissena polymorpha]|uniref:uncharacterized protein LOC127853961 isoform X2 n=1 Tax=Dreissena polymorpha TaxID=45954 RepID=UPI002264CC1B|nr:uncharacterized protein LOC127853961 isoform X2 [Dreissena polymorpha]